MNGVDDIVRNALKASAKNLGLVMQSPLFACLLPPFSGAGNSARAQHRLGTLRQNIRSAACRS